MRGQVQQRGAELEQQASLLSHVECLGGDAVSGVACAVRGLQQRCHCACISQNCAVHGGEQFVMQDVELARIFKTSGVVTQTRVPLAGKAGRQGRREQPEQGTQMAQGNAQLVNELCARQLRGKRFGRLRLRLRLRSGERQGVGDIGLPVANAGVGAIAKGLDHALVGAEGGDFGVGGAQRQVEVQAIATLGLGHVGRHQRQGLCKLAGKGEQV